MTINNLLNVFDAGVFSDPKGYVGGEFMDPTPIMAPIADAIVCGIISRYFLKAGWKKGLIVGGLVGAALGWKAYSTLAAIQKTQDSNHWNITHNPDGSVKPQFA
jgi:hypothetical protein